MQQTTLLKEALNSVAIQSLKPYEVIEVERFLKRNDTFNLGERNSFSIIIVTYKNEDTIKDCIGSFIETLTDQDEVIILDNSPDNKTEEALTDYLEKYKNIKFIKNEENLGYAKAINKGVKLSENSYLVFLNPDTVVVSKDWLVKFSQHLSKDEKVVAVGPVSNAAFFHNNIINYLNVELLGEIGIEETANLLQNLYKDKEIEARILFKFCIATKKDYFLEYGMFDESLILEFNDFDYSMFINENGYKQLVIPSVYVYHEDHHSFNKEKKMSSALNKTSFDNFMRKLIRKYGYGNIPEPFEYFSNRTVPSDFKPFSFLESGRYRYSFNFSGSYKDKNFFKEKAKVIKSNPKVAVITVNYKSYRDVLELAKSIDENDYKNVDFIVVDNSEDEIEYENLSVGLEEIFKNSNKNYFILKNVNSGYAGGNNLGIKFALEEPNVDYIWLLNPDTVITSGSILELLRTVEFTDIPVATCKIVDYHSGACQYNGESVDLSGHRKDCNTKGIFRASFLSGANIFLKKDIIERVGFFDEKYFLYFEDNEFFKRLIKSGIYPLFTPFTYIYHKGGTSTEGFLKKPISIYYYVRNLLHWTTENSENHTLGISLLNALKQIESIYINNLHKTQNLRAVIFGIRHFFYGIYGKIEIDFKIKPDKRVEKIETSNPKEELNNLLDYLIWKPKDLEAFKKLTENLLKLKVSYSI